MSGAVSVSVIAVLGWPSDFALIGHHEGFEAWDDGCHYAVADFELSARDSIGRDQINVRGVDFDVKVVKAEAGECYHSERKVVSILGRDRGDGEGGAYGKRQPKAQTTIAWISSTFE